jgi:hypothetical protein
MKNPQLKDFWHKHQTCQVVIYNKKFTNGEVVPGLYCKDFGIWIQWLDIETADQLIDQGVEQVLEQPKKRKGHPVKRLTVEEFFNL